MQTQYESEVTLFELFESGVTLFQNLDKHGKIVYNDLVYNTIIQYAFKFGFIGVLSFAVGEGLAPPATQKILCYLIPLQISGGASPSPTNFSNPPLNSNLKHWLNSYNWFCRGLRVANNLCRERRPRRSAPFGFQTHERNRSKTVTNHLAQLFTIMLLTEDVAPYNGVLVPEPSCPIARQPPIFLSHYTISHRRCQPVSNRKTTPHWSGFPLCIKALQRLHGILHQRDIQVAVTLSELVDELLLLLLVAHDDAVV